MTRDSRDTQPQPDLADRLKAAIAARGLKQSTLAAEAGIPPETLSRILTRTTENPGIHTVSKIAKVLGESVGSLLGERGYEITDADRERAREFVGWLTERFALDARPGVHGAELPVELPIELPHNGADVLPFSARTAAAAAVEEPVDYRFPIVETEFIEHDYDYPRPLHAWVVPEAAPVAAGPHGIESDSPLSTAQVIHSIRDVRNALLQVVRVIGDSMCDVLRDGYKVLVDTTLTTPANGDIVAVYVKDEGGMIGYWNKQGDSYSLTKENPDYGRVDLGDPTEWLLWGTVTTIVEAPLERKPRRR
jgi:transcriptional regulator with XRE-family HTH domain